MGGLGALHARRPSKTRRRQGIATIQAIKDALLRSSTHQDAHKFYSQDLINNLFLHPYTKIDFLKDDLGVSRLTATKYLDALVADGIAREAEDRPLELLHQPSALRHPDGRGHDRGPMILGENGPGYGGLYTLLSNRRELACYLLA